MNISVECNQCQADFELEVSDLIKEPGLFVCPNCGVKADPEVVEAMATALDEAVSQAARLRRRFRISFGVEDDELENEEVAEAFADDDAEEEGLWGDEPEEEEEEE